MVLSSMALVMITKKIERIKGRLEELGYDSSMIMVNTSDEISAERNVERGQRGGRNCS
jgi:hypothetical protein